MAEPIRDKFEIANLGYFLDLYVDGASIQDRESDLFRVFFQTPREVAYDRENGGGVENLEQEPQSQKLFLRFSINIIETVYRINAERDFDPFVILGFSDISQSKEPDGPNKGETVISVKHRLLSDPRNVEVAEVKI